jgi:hypothetical protein
MSFLSHAYRINSSGMEALTEQRNMTWYRSSREHHLRQKPIEDYFKPLKPRKKQLPHHFLNTATIAQYPLPGRVGLLDLPRPVFRIIMHHLSADFTRDCAILLNKRPSIDFFDDDGNLEEKFKPEWDGMPNDVSEMCRFMSWLEMCPNDSCYQFHCKCPEISLQFRSLITCCRAFWLELSAMFFSKNSFVVHRCAHGGMLRPLKSIGSTNLAALTSLRIMINSAVPTYISRYLEMDWRKENSGQTYCRCYCNDPVPNDALYPYEFCICEGVDRPFSQVITGRGRRAIQELEKVVSLLKSLIKPGQLELGIVCDCKNLTTAEAFISVLCGLPKLRSCALRLSLSNDKSIRSLAAQTVAKLCGEDKAINLSGFTRLPRELRVQILEHTDLVAPTDIDFNPSWPFGGFTLQFQRQSKLHICEPVSDWNEQSVSYATSCGCWKFPLSLFLVNKEFNHDATRIFFSQNHFIVLPRRGRIHHLNEDESELVAYYFDIQKWSPSALPWLRSLQISIPLDGSFLDPTAQNEYGHPIEDTYDYAMDEVMFWEYPAEYQEWRDQQLSSRPWMRSRARLYGAKSCGYRLAKALQGIPLNNLELTLDFRSLDKLRDWGKFKNWYIAGLVPMFQRVVDVVAIVKQHSTEKRGFSKFFIHVPKEMDENCAQRLEKMIMGEDYDSFENGKFLFPNRFEYWGDYLKREREYLVGY